MKVFAIADLHLPGRDAKPMEVFGDHWLNHFERIAEDWAARVGPDDLVLLPGDLSWAMRLEDATDDLRAIGDLPGKKAILRGNHDYWWSSIGRVRDALPPGMFAVQNDCVVFPEFVLAGTRGWIIPDGDADADDERIYQRELLRLEMSLKAARSKSADGDLIVMMHYPPRTQAVRETGFTRLLEDYRAKHVVYGHLHGDRLRAGFRGCANGVQYYLAACDALGFRLLELPM